MKMDILSITDIGSGHVVISAGGVDYSLPMAAVTSRSNELAAAAADWVANGGVISTIE